jgi:hypothetical protein
VGAPAKPAEWLDVKEILFRHMKKLGSLVRAIL